MDIQSLNKELGNIDIYLLDQILKGHIPLSSKILDAGCGEGRNLIYFLNNGYVVSGIDNNEDAIRLLKFIIGANYRTYDKAQFQVGSIDAMPYADLQYDYVICNAVLHFAKTHDQFWQMICELYRVTQRGGTLFVRMTSDFGLHGHQAMSNNDQYLLPDGSMRYLLTNEMLDKIYNQLGFENIEPVKTVIVADQRCMTTLVMRKK